MIDFYLDLIIIHTILSTDETKAPEQVEPVPDPRTSAPTTPPAIRGVHSILYTLLCSGVAKQGVVDKSLCFPSHGARQGVMATNATDSNTNARWDAVSDWRLEVKRGSMQLNHKVYGFEFRSLVAENRELLEFYHFMRCGHSSSMIFKDVMGSREPLNYEVLRCRFCGRERRVLNQ